MPFSFYERHKILPEFYLLYIGGLYICYMGSKWIGNVEGLICIGLTPGNRPILEVNI